jgi:hypothetical protein
MEQKKLYVKPEETVVEMKTQQILCASMEEPAREYTFGSEEEN